MALEEGFKVRFMYDQRSKLLSGFSASNPDVDRGDAMTIRKYDVHGWFEMSEEFYDKNPGAGTSIQVGPPPAPTPPRAACAPYVRPPPLHPTRAICCPWAGGRDGEA